MLSGVKYFQNGGGAGNDAEKAAGLGSAIVVVGVAQRLGCKVNEGQRSLHAFGELGRIGDRGRRMRGDPGSLVVKTQAE